MWPMPKDNEENDEQRQDTPSPQLQAANKRLLELRQQQQPGAARRATVLLARIIARRGE